MSRISSLFFIISLLIYYIPKLFNFKKQIFLKLHIGAGLLSTLAMIVALVQAIVSKGDVFKYLGFSIVMVLISATGYFIKKNYKNSRILHIGATVSFFAYLFIVVKFL